MYSVQIVHEMGKGSQCYRNKGKAVGAPSRVAVNVDMKENVWIVKYELQTE